MFDVKFVSNNFMCFVVHVSLRARTASQAFEVALLSKIKSTCLIKQKKNALLTHSQIQFIKSALDIEQTIKKTKVRRTYFGCNDLLI